MTMVDDETVAKQRAIAIHVARVCHEANRAYCLTMGDTSHAPWDDARQDLKDSVVAGVLNIMHGEVTKPGESHKRWYDYKVDAGWRYGETKDPDAKTHPNLVAFEQLPLSEQRKDVLFVSICNTLLGMWPRGTFK
jgi:hypothetical protein